MTRSGYGREERRRDDGPESLRAWRLRAYMDHLEDLGYELDGGGNPVVEEPMPDRGIPREHAIHAG